MIARVFSEFRTSIFEAAEFSIDSMLLLIFLMISQIVFRNTNMLIDRLYKNYICSASLYV
jgi:hypothetical protein